MNNRIATAVVFVACAALYAPVIGGHFLSDDMAVIYVLSEWQERGELWSRLFAKFAAGLDAPSHYYRPLPFLSFGLNLALPGFDSAPWHLVNLAGHLAAGAAVYRIANELRPDAPSRAGAWIAAALFLFCGTSAEAVGWISGRYDIFATAFSLWAAALFLNARSGLDHHALGALVLGALALASKESAAVLPGLIGCLAWIKHGVSPPRQRWTRIVRDLAPWALLIAAYLGLRTILFDSMLQVYPGTDPLQRIVDGGWSASVRAFWPWLGAALPSPPLLWIAVLLSALLIATGTLIVTRDRSLWRQAIGMLGAILWSLALLLPHLSGLPANGEGGRLLYTTSALVALTAGIPFGARCGSVSVGWRSMLLLAGVALSVTHAALLHVVLRDWRIAGGQMAQLIAALPVLKKSLQPGGYGLVVAPDAIGSAPFARNAQGAMLLPPIAEHELLSRMIVFLPSDLVQLPSLLHENLILVLQRYSLREAAAQMKKLPRVESDDAVIWPSDVFCWAPAESALRRVPLTGIRRTATDWEKDMKVALRSSGCAAWSRL